MQEDAWIESLNAERMENGLAPLQRGVALPVKGRPLYPDAFDPETRTVYEFNGCYWHGCFYYRNGY